MVNNVNALFGDFEDHYAVEIRTNTWYMVYKPVILISITNIDNVTDEDILKKVRFARENKELLLAYYLATDVAETHGTEVAYQFWTGDYDLLCKNIEILKRNPAYMKTAKYISLLESAKDDIERSRALDEHIKNTRFEFSRIRRGVFSRLCELYGYKCNKCRSTNDLQIDHILAIHS
jgi:hypothetical protein